ncbi:MAG: ABC transporter permease [Caldilineaceae bacterium]|nr:ABC transporter permease [Caldilineaceae bacterium]MCB0183597.1 ABC transporter permease [Caldilineaceae bacterium]
MTLEAQSDQLFDLYRELDARLAQERYAEDVVESSATQKEDEGRYSLSQWQLMWRKFVRNRAALTGGIVILLFYLTALFANFLAPYTLTTRFRDRIYMPPQAIHFFDNGQFAPFVYGVKTGLNLETLERIAEVDTDVKYPIGLWVPGESYHLFGLIEMDRHLFGTVGDGAVTLLGTDRQGRDMLTRILIGSQVSLTIGLVGVALSLTLGTILGVVSGFFGGWVDELIQRVIELVRSFPSIPLWMALSAAIPAAWPPMRVYFAVTLILSLIGWTWLARQLRGQVLTLRSQDFVLAAKLMGASNGRIIFKHLVPASIGHIIVVATLAMPGMILAETALSFLGLGLQPPITSWGVLIKEVQDLQSIALYPWVFSPVIFIVVAILAFNFLGDGLRDAADPYTR